ncbi:hypothetical protein ABZ897_59040 [Nonomuraea sp. NPDC046802]|uniref:hypothetical protein n=1 Tax=Nonomuraea sp. NPDC046802 TaxID=3154919 RepID=UPI0033DAF930
MAFGADTPLSEVVLAITFDPAEVRVDSGDGVHSMVGCGVNKGHFLLRRRCCQNLAPPGRSSARRSLCGSPACESFTEVASWHLGNLPACQVNLLPGFRSAAGRGRSSPPSPACNSKVVVVAVNKGTSAVSQQFTLVNSTAANVSSWLTDASRNVAPQGTTGVSNGSFTVTLPARSVMTFVTG